MEIAFIVHTARAALLLDRDGFCRWYVMKEEDEGSLATARRCVGAQFVASLDHDEPGLLLHEPLVGTSALFARNADGRMSLVRFGPLVEVESLEGTVLAALPVVEVPEAPSVPAEADSNAWLPRYETLLPAARESEREHEDEHERDLEQGDEISTVIGWRSGFQIRAVPAVEHDPDMPHEENELATNQFLRQTLDLGETGEPTSKRRGILPRRRTG